MTITFSDLPEEMVEKILPRVPITSLSSIRSTCKKWEAISKNHLLEAATGNQFMGFILRDFNLCSMKFDLQGIHDDVDFIQPSVKEVSRLDQYEISQIFHCDGLLLCVFKDHVEDGRITVWNMYLGQMRWIKPSGIFNRFHKSGVYALGYDSKNRNHKILRNKSQGFGYEIYDFKSDSWRVLKRTPNEYTQFEGQGGLSLKGNAYFLAVEEFPVSFEGDVEEGVEAEDTTATRVILLCFDFTKERFGRRMYLPFYSEGDGEDHVALSCVRDEKLAVLYQQYDKIEIWTSTKLQPKASWSEFLKVDLMTPNGGFPDDFAAGSFFIDEEKEVAVVFEKEIKIGSYHTAYIIGKDGYFKAVNIGDAPARYRRPVVCSTSYIPSLVQVKRNKSGKRKKRDY